MFRLAINSALKGGVIYLLGLLHVLTPHAFIRAGSPWAMIWSMVLLGLVFVVVHYIAWTAYSLLVLFSAGIAIIALPFVWLGMGYLVLRLMAGRFPETLTLTSSFWLTLLAGLIIMAVGLKPRSNNDD